jgi:hypothetical protein
MIDAVRIRLGCGRLAVEATRGKGHNVRDNVHLRGDLHHLNRVMVVVVVSQFNLHLVGENLEG